MCVHRELMRVRACIRVCGCVCKGACMSMPVYALTNYQRGNKLNQGSKHKLSGLSPDEAAVPKRANKYQAGNSIEHCVEKMNLSKCKKKTR